PCNKIGHVSSDQDIMIGAGEITKFVGNVLAVAAAEKAEDLEEILNLIQVEYTELPAVTSPSDALRSDAPLVHPDTTSNLLNATEVKRGDIEQALRRSKYVVTKRYVTSWQEHGYMETECCVAMPEGADGLLLFTGSQSVYDVRRECAQMLNLPLEKVHCRAPLIGGGFGGKEDMTVQPYAALMAWYLKRPVKFRYTRQQSLDYHVKRHPMEMEFTLACDENGYFTAMQGKIVADTGAYASLGMPVIHRACVHAAGPYRYEAIDVEGFAYYTNNVPSGAFRGFGVAQSCFATEMNIDLLAEMTGLDPWTIHYRNAVRPGDVLPNGQIASSDTNLLACLEALKPYYDANPKAGLACAFKNSGIGLGRPDVGRVMLSVESGRLHVRTSAACMGQGLGQTMLTVVGEITGIPADSMVFEEADTVRTPDSGSSSASRQTLITGEAVRRAALQFRDALQHGQTLADLEGQTFYGEYQTETDGLDSGKEHPVSHVAYSYGAQMAVLDDKGFVSKIISAFDVGTPVNIKSVEGQIEGGALMGLGFAVSERYVYADGYPQSRLATLGLLRADRAPEQKVILCVPPADDRIPYALGAKGCGELCAIPTPPACAHAYYQRDSLFRQSLPLEGTPYRR
ncbi:selenium-dependent xanthine dehydrogenase, partial [bacterium]|nr:selenium-dependent xanthine dehydrogenase [bacterium]